MSCTISTESLVDSSVWGEEEKESKGNVKGKRERERPGGFGGIPEERDGGGSKEKERLKAWDNEKESVKELINYQREEAALKSEIRISKSVPGEIL